MRHDALVALAASQHNRVARRQLAALGYSPSAVKHLIVTRRLARAGAAVYALPPVLDDPRARWMAATLPAEGSVLSHASAGAAWRLRPWSGTFETVTRPGDGGPRRHGGVLIHHSQDLERDLTTLDGIPITTGARTVLDLAVHLDARAIARCVREALRLQATTEAELAATLDRHRGRRGAARVRRALDDYRGLPLPRARSDAEALALHVFAAARRPLPRLNRHVAGEEADLSWPSRRLIVELDGPQFHRDVGEDARKQTLWEGAGWAVNRLPTDDVYHHPERLLALAPGRGAAA